MAGTRLPPAPTPGFILGAASFSVASASKRKTPGGVADWLSSGPTPAPRCMGGIQEHEFRLPTRGQVDSWGGGDPNTERMFKNAGDPWQQETSTVDMDPEPFQGLHAPHRLGKFRPNTPPRPCGVCSISHSLDVPRSDLLGLPRPPQPCVL